MARIKKYHYLMIRENDILKKQQFVKWKEINRILKRMLLDKDTICETCSKHRLGKSKLYIIRCIKYHPEFVVTRASAMLSLLETFKEIRTVTDKVDSKIEEMRITGES